jgi:hypothetical protein
MSEGRKVQRPQPLDRRVRVRGRLEVGHELIADITPLEPPDTLVDLIADALARQSTAGAKAAVVAKRAAASRHGPVDVRASESSIDADLLDTLPVRLPKKEAVRIVAQARSPPVEVAAKFGDLVSID